MWNGDEQLFEQKCGCIIFKDGAGSHTWSFCKEHRALVEETKRENEYEAECLLCGKIYDIELGGGNELGFCVDCQEKPDFPYDLDAYYRDYDAGKVAFKDFETMQRGILEPYRKDKAKMEK